MLIDTHAHLFSFDFAQDEWPGQGGWDGIIRRAKDAGVERIIVPGTDLESSKQAVELAKRYPEIIKAAVGIHPEELVVESNIAISNIKKLVSENREQVVAIGEIGTDKSSLKLIANSLKQRQFFKEQCEMAVGYDLPVIIHTRESLRETIEVLDGLPKMPRGQFHCFSYDESELKQILKRGFYVSFCGNITWSKRLQRVMPRVPSERLLLETDSPFMTPLALKGQRNEPSNVKITAELQANLLGITLEELGEKTTENAKRLFGI